MICVDASVAAKWLFVEDLTAQADALYDASVAASDELVAPALLAMEIANTIRRRTRAPGSVGQQPLSLEEARGQLQRFLRLPIRLESAEDLHVQALELAHSHGLPAVYDAYYLALAQTMGCPLWTADRRLVNALQGRLPFVRWLGDYSRQPLG